MTRCLSIALVVLSLLLATAATALAEAPCRGAADLVADLVPSGGVLSITDDGSTVTIVVKQGPSRISTTVVTYEDNDDSFDLNCGDTVISVVTTIS